MAMTGTGTGTPCRMTHSAVYAGWLPKPLLVRRTIKVLGGDEVVDQTDPCHLNNSSAVGGRWHSAISFGDQPIQISRGSKPRMQPFFARLAFHRRRFLTKLK
jgi:hypothetical protein